MSQMTAAAAADSVANMLNDAEEQNDDIIPFDLYNFEQGKLLASLSWLISKVYGKNIPDSLIQPCYKDDNNILHLKPPTMYSLTSGDLYCAAASTIFHDVGYLNQNHAVILQALNRYSIQVVDADENFVTETVLTHTAPFKTNAHLAMIDALMIAYTREIINVPRVIQCLKKYVNVHPNETPSDIDDALSFWINKICAAVRDNLEKNQVTKNADLPIIPEMDDLYEDFCDGACVATLISFYAHDQLNLKDICFNDPMGFGDCLHNLRLIQTFCSKFLPWNIFHFAFEDILYVHESLQPNILAFLTDLFYFFESTQDVKSPPIGATVTKRFFNRVGIPDLRSIEKDAHTKQNDSKPSVSRPTKLSHAHTKEPLTVTNSVGTSRMNSTDSLMTERSVDSLRYQPYKTSSTMETPMTPSTTFAENVIDMLASKHSPTSKPPDVASPQNGNGNSMSAYYVRSDSLNRQDSNKAPSWSVRMQLEEKRRQIEAQQMMEKSERFKQGQQINKDAFMKLYGKNTMSSSMTTQQNFDASKLGVGDQHHSASAINNNSSQYDEMCRSIIEIKEQMKQMAVEQERLQNFVVAAPPQQHSNYSSPPPSMVQSYEGGDVRQHVIIQQQPMAQHQTPFLTAGPFLANGHTLIRYSHEAEPFRLHSEDETPSRLDPALELSNDFSTWGMTNKAPRRTWENQGFANQTFANQNFVDQQGRSGNNAASVYVNSPSHQMEFQQQMHQQQAFMQQPPPPPMMHMPMVAEEVLPQKHSPPYGEIVPAEPHWIPPPSVTIYSNAPYVASSSSSYVIVTMAPSTTVISSFKDGAASSSARSIPATASSTPPNVQQTVSPPPPNDGGDAIKYFTPSANVNTGGGNNRPSNGSLHESHVLLPASSVVNSNLLNRTPSPTGVGFIIEGDENAINEELNRKREQIVAAAMNRKAQLDRRRDMLNEDANRRQEELAKKEESERQKKREKEMRRIKVFEDYQRKKAEQEALGTSKTSLSSKTGSLRGHRPMSPVIGKSVPNVRSTSAENLDQVDGKSQSSDGQGSSSQISEPTTKLFVKPAQKSNRNIIYNALQYCVLAGSVNDDKKRKCLEVLAKSDSKHFLILFRDQKCQFRGLYGWDQTSDVVQKLFGLGPSSCSEKIFSSLFKYDSGAKQFNQIPSKHLSATIDGFTIEDSFWQSKKPLYAKSKTMK